MTNEDSRSEFALPRRVRRMVYGYIMRRTEHRCQIKWDDFRDKRVHDAASGRDRIDVPQKYREAREKVCTDAFLRMRSCRSRQDFVEYFIGTICSGRNSYRRTSTTGSPMRSWEVKRRGKT
jgi:CRISPR-associated protein Cmx8